MQHWFIGILFSLALLFGKQSPGQQAYTRSAEKPRLVVGIVVDQLRFQDLRRYRHRLSPDGFKRLMEEGSFYTNQFYQNLLTQSAVSHATITTGASPAIHGIVSREWYESLQDHVISCVYDAESRATGNQKARGNKGASLLKAPSFTNNMKLNSRFQSRVFSVGFKDQDAILAAGQMADAAYWFDLQAGSWVSSSFYLDELPEWVETFNQKNSADTLMKEKWDLLHPLETYTASRSDRNDYEPGFGRFANGFPYRLAWLSRKDDDYEILRYTPYADKLTVKFAKSLIKEELPGRDSITDYMAISLTTTEGIADLFGPFSVEHEDAFIRTDKRIAEILNFLETQYDRDSILVFLTGAHGAPLLPGFMKQAGGNAGYFTHRSAIALLKAYLRAVYGQGNWVKHYTQQQVFLNRTLIEDQEVPLPDIRRDAARFMTQFSGVSNAIPADAVVNKNFTSGIYQKFQHNYYPNRSGDVLLNLEPGWVERYGGITHTAYNYDTHVPLFWYGWQVEAQEVARRVSPKQIAPTITHILGIGYPDAADSEPLIEIVNAGK